MLVTGCKLCGARFRVTPEQLNLRQGQVRCGQCHEVFNGFQSLERFPGDDTGTRLLAARAGALHDFKDIADVPDLPLESAVSAAEPMQEAEGDAATPSTPPDLPPPPAPSTQGAAFGRYDAPLVTRASRAWVFGVVFLVVVLGMQLAYAFRAQLAQQYPPLRPVLESACATAGCTVPWINDEAALKLEDSELLEVPGKPGQIALQARIRNLSSSAQEFPHLELTLTDLTGQTAVRRVLRPTDYLGRTPVAGEVMPAGSEALLSVRLESSRIRPTGYELLLFYP